MTQLYQRLVPLLRLLSLSIAVGLFSTNALAEPKASPEKSESAKSAQATTVIDLNRATEQDLLTLPGVGPAKAQAILALRTRLKGFKRVEDLMRVKGIGRKTFQKLRPLVRVGR